MLAELGVHAPFALHHQGGTHLDVAEVAYKSNKILVTLDAHSENRPSVLLVLIGNALDDATYFLHIFGKLFGVVTWGIFLQ